MGLICRDGRGCDSSSPEQGAPSFGPFNTRLDEALEIRLWLRVRGSELGLAAPGWVVQLLWDTGQSDLASPRSGDVSLSQD